MRSPRTARKSSLHLLQLERARVQQRRPDAAKNKNKKKNKENKENKKKKTKQTKKATPFMRSCRVGTHLTAKDLHLQYGYHLQDSFW